MSNRVRLYISALCYYTGLVKLIRWWFQRTGPYLIILYYHSAAGEHLRRQWLYLRRHYRILRLEAALEEIYMPPRGKTHQQDRRALLALTFDDGYYDNYAHAFRLASALRVPITIFLLPGYIGCAHAFWWADRLLRLARVELASFEGHTYHLDQLGERKALAQIIDERVNQTASIVEREQFLLSICELLAVPSSTIPREEPAPLITWAQIHEMEKSGWVSFGAHTIHHADLQHLTNPAELRYEVGGCRTMLEQQLGRSVDTFAYPHGNIGEYGLCAAMQAGYKWALTIQPGRNTCQSNPYLLYRMNTHANVHMLIVAAEVAGIWSFFTYLKRLVKRVVRIRL